MYSWSHNQRPPGFPTMPYASCPHPHHQMTAYSTPVSPTPVHSHSYPMHMPAYPPNHQNAAHSTQMYTTNPSYSNAPYQQTYAVRAHPPQTHPTPMHSPPSALPPPNYAHRGRDEPSAPTWPNHDESGTFTLLSISQALTARCFCRTKMNFCITKRSFYRTNKM